MLEVLSLASSSVVILAVALLVYLERERVLALFGIEPATGAKIPDLYLRALSVSVRIESKVIMHLIPYTQFADQIERFSRALREQESVIEELKKIEASYTASVDSN